MPLNISYWVEVAEKSVICPISKLTSDVGAQYDCDILKIYLLYSLPVTTGFWISAVLTAPIGISTESIALSWLVCCPFWLIKGPLRLIPSSPFNKNDINIEPLWLKNGLLWTLYLFLNKSTWLELISSPTSSPLAVATKTWSLCL